MKQKERQIIGPCLRRKKVEDEGDADTNCRYACNGLQRFGNGTGRIGNPRKNRDHPVLLRSARVLRRVLETKQDRLSL